MALQRLHARAPRLVVALLGRAEALLDEEALEEVKRRLVTVAVPTGGRWSPGRNPRAMVNHSLRLAQDMTLPAAARAIFSETAATLQTVMEEEARQWRDAED